MIKIKKKFFIVIILSFILCSVATAFLCIDKSRFALQGNYENENRNIAGLISNDIEKSFLRPITVSETMSKDYTTKEILSAGNKNEAEKTESSAADYLESLKAGFGYTMVYAVSDLSKAYFSSNGISKYMDPENDEHDLWYRNFLKSGKPYVLDVDTDEANGWALSVFINAAVYDDSYSLLGVCGVGVDMQELIKLLERYERIYDIKINLVNADGLIQVDTDMSRIERDSLDTGNLREFSDGEYYYEILPHGSRTITYLDRLDWYLVVQNDNMWTEQINGIVFPCLVCLGICFVIFITAMNLGIEKDIKKESDISE